jgi:hypothetical protein
VAWGGIRLQIGGAKSFGEPLINRRQQIARLTDAVPVAQQAGEARGSAEFPFDPSSPPTCVLSRWNIVGRKEVPAGLGSRPGSTTGFTVWAFAFYPPLSFFRAAPNSAQKKGRMIDAGL